MTKILALVRRRAGADAETILAAWRETALTPALSRCLVGIADVDPALLARQRGEDRYAAVVELWLDDGYPFETLLEGPLVAIAPDTEAYAVSERIVKDDGLERLAGTTTPGIKTVFPIVRLPSLTRAAFDNHWEHSHGPLATRVHIGMSKYVQNSVVECLTDAAPDYDGFTETFFPTAEDHRERFFGSPEGMAAIRDDVARFVASAVPLSTTEHVLK